MAIWATDIKVQLHETRVIVGHPWWPLALAVVLVVPISVGLIWLRRRRRSSTSAG
jgi:hypothetical protein